MDRRRLVSRTIAIAVSTCLLVSLVVARARQPTSIERHAGVREATLAGWTTRGVEILNPAGKAFQIAGTSWYGFETPQFAPYGLDQQDYRAVLGEIKGLQYNTVRIPFSDEMWDDDPLPSPRAVKACPECSDKHARDVIAEIINYAGAIGLHVILDNHRSAAGSSTQQNGLWYDTSGGQPYTESAWIGAWVDVQRWVHGVKQTTGALDTVRVDDVAADGFPTVIGYDLRNEPHTPPGASYLDGATWGTGDGIDPRVDPNPNPFAPACVATSTCHDWRLAAERAADTMLGDAARRGWALPLIFVQGTSTYPAATGTTAAGPYDTYRWGGELEGVNGNANHPGAPIVLNLGGSAAGLGPAVSGGIVYTTRDYGPSLTSTPWFTQSTCYRLGCADQATFSLVEVWCQAWAYIDLPPGQYGSCSGGIHPSYTAAFPWSNTGSTPYAQAPVWIGEFGTGTGEGDLTSPVRGSQGQWFTDLVNFIESSSVLTATNNPGIPVKALNWTYWAVNSTDRYALFGPGYKGLANAAKQYSYLCAIIGDPGARGPRQCGSTGALPPPF